MQVIKRDGSIVDFDYHKITRALHKANHDDVPENYQISAAEIEEIASSIEDMDIPLKVEQIQDLIEKQLMQRHYFTLAKKYITYRYTRQQVREAKATDDDILTLIQGNNEDLNTENSNKNTFVASTQRDYIAGIASKDITKRVLLPKKIVRAHEQGILHFHDMDYFIQPIFNCCLINIGDMLDNGTVINGKMIESPQSFRVACTIMTQIIANVASNQYGGQSVDICHLGKYLRRSFDKKYKQRYHVYLERGYSEEDCCKFATEDADQFVKEELEAGVQTIQYQINTLMTTNGQSPFVTLFLNVDLNNEYHKEVAMIIEEILRQRLEGIKNDQGVYITPAFPKLIYVLHEHNALKGGEYDYLTKLAAKCSNKRMYPDYISAKKMRENYEGNVFSCMGCRSFLSPWKDENGEYKFEGRFNQGVVSLNLPKVAIMATKTTNNEAARYKMFWDILNEHLDLCFDALMCRHKALCNVTSDVSPLHWQYGALARLQPGESIKPLLYGGYSSISLGYIGVYEMVKLMTGDSHTTKVGQTFALEVLNYLKQKTEEWKEETNIGFGLYGTPAESLCYRFAEIDRKLYGDIEDVTDKGYYTNSYHVDVREPIDLFSKFTFESQFQSISTGGCISYAELPSLSQNVEAIEAAIRFIYDNIQYAEFNSKSDYCANCGFDDEILVNDDNQWECPSCHCKDKRLLTVTRRTCGYLGENFWNEGKTKEIKARVTHL